MLLDGVSAVAVPIFGTDERLAAVLAALGISGRFDPLQGSYRAETEPAPNKRLL